MKCDLHLPSDDAKSYSYKSTFDNVTDSTNLPFPKKRKSFHRKTNSQIFSCEDLLNLNNLNTDHSCLKKEEIPFLSLKLNTESDNLQFGKTISPSVNDSFTSVRIVEDVNNEISSSVIIKEENYKQESHTIPFVSNKSFIPLINNLKFAKEKEEKATESYLLALGLDKNPTKNDYNTGSIIEEEKSDMLISESDFSSKKKILSKFNNQNKLDDINLNLNSFVFKNVQNSFKQETDINNNNNHINKLTLTINEMIKRKAEKEKNHRNQLTYNKKYLLNTFYTLTNTSSISNQSKKISKTEKFNTLTKVAQAQTQTKKKRRTLSQNLEYNKEHIDDKLELQFQDKKNKNNVNLIRKIPSNKKIPNKGLHSKNPTLVLNYHTKPASHQNIHYHIKKKSFSNTKDLNEKKSEQKKQNFSNALTLIQTYRNKKNNLLNNFTSRSGRDSTSINTHTNTRSNSQSSRSNDKKNIYFKKTKSQINLNHILPSSEREKTSVNLFKGNKSEIMNALKNQILFTKLYEKKDVIDKITIASNGFYLVMCERKQSLLYPGSFDYVSYYVFIFFSFFLDYLNIIMIKKDSLKFTVVKNVKILFY